MYHNKKHIANSNEDISATMERPADNWDNSDFNSTSSTNVMSFDYNLITASSHTSNELSFSIMIILQINCLQYFTFTWLQ